MIVYVLLSVLATWVVLFRCGHAFRDTARQVDRTSREIERWEPFEIPGDALVEAFQFLEAKVRWRDELHRFLSVKQLPPGPPLPATHDSLRELDQRLYLDRQNSGLKDNYPNLLRIIADQQQMDGQQQQGALYGIANGTWGSSLLGMIL